MQLSKSVVWQWVIQLQSLVLKNPVSDEHGHEINMPPKPYIYTKPTQKYRVFSHFSLFCVLCSAFVSFVLIFFFSLSYLSGFQSSLPVARHHSFQSTESDLFNLTAMNSRKLEPITWTIKRSNWKLSSIPSVLLLSYFLFCFSVNQTKTMQTNRKTNKQTHKPVLLLDSLIIYQEIFLGVAWHSL